MRKFMSPTNNKSKMFSKDNWRSEIKAQLTQIGLKPKTLIHYKYDSRNKQKLLDINIHNNKTQPATFNPDVSDIDEKSGITPPRHDSYKQSYKFESEPKIDKWPVLLFLPESHNSSSLKKIKAEDQIYSTKKFLVHKRNPVYTIESITQDRRNRIKGITYNTPLRSVKRHNNMDVSALMEIRVLL